MSEKLLLVLPKGVKLWVEVQVPQLQKQSMKEANDLHRFA